MFVLKSLLLAPLALASVLPREEPVNYDGYKVYRIATKGDDEGVMSRLSELEFDQWNRLATEHVDISIAGSEVEKFEALGLEYSVMHEDLGADIAAEAEPVLSKRQANTGPSSNWFDSYHSYADHVTYWRNLQASFPQNSQSFVAGKSFQGRDIFGLKLFGRNTGATKEALVWHGTVHAREWISGMTVEFLASSIVDGYKRNDPAYTSILDTYDLYILPFTNPDGFVYSQTTDRLWRKNRSPGPTARSCIGTDNNRNWPYQWTGNPQGASTNPCAQTYKGRSAGDTPENRAMVSHLQSVARAQPIKQYLDFHSYGNYLLSPYGYTSNLPSNNAAQVNLANRAAAAIRSVYGTAYRTGPAGATLYPTTGSSIDYAFDVSGADYSYTFELRDTGENGFVLPANQIRPTAEEVLAGIRVLISGM